MITIWRYRVRMHEAFTLELTAPGTIVAVRAARARDSDLEFWAYADLDDGEAPKVTRRITVVGTGNPIPSPWPGEHVGTTFHDGGASVFHVFAGPIEPGGKPEGGDANR